MVHATRSIAQVIVNNREDVRPDHRRMALNATKQQATYVVTSFQFAIPVQ